MSNKGQLLQDPFLNTLRKEHVPVSIYLVNGIKLQGQIESFDQYVVLLRNSVTQMVYKHAISTVVPSRPISLGADKDSECRLQQHLQETSRPAADPQAAIIVCLDFGDDAYEESVEEVVRLVESAGVRRHSVVKGRRTRPRPEVLRRQRQGGRNRSRGRGAERGLRDLQPRAFSGTGEERGKELARRVMDRTELILEIFAQRARRTRASCRWSSPSSSTSRRAWCAAGRTSSASAAAWARPAARARPSSSSTGATSPTGFAS